MNITEFRSNHTLENRIKESNRLLNTYEFRIPIILEVYKNNNNIILDKYKFLVTSELSIGQFICVVRKRMTIESVDAIFIFFNNMLIPNTELISNVYKTHKDEDGFLYAVISSENTFG